jgi:hypothetical protein
MTIVLNDSSIMTLGLLVILSFMTIILVINSVIYLKICINDWGKESWSGRRHAWIVGCEVGS